MNAEFNWWLLIVGLVVGAGLVWLVIADWSRREEDLSEEERAAESEWIAEALRARGEPIDVAAADEVLALHREYLRQAGLLTDDAEQAGEAVAEPLSWAEPQTWSEPEPGTWSEPEPPARSESERGLWQAHPIAAPDVGNGSLDRGSVRARPIAPRGGAAGMESEPPAS
jgi:hypothetical protein